MTHPGAPFDQTGILVRDAGGFALRSDGGGLWRLMLPRVPVDKVEKRVRVVGVYAGDCVVEADGVASA